MFQICFRGTEFYKAKNKAIGNGPYCSEKSVQSPNDLIRDLVQEYIYIYIYIVLNESGLSFLYPRVLFAKSKLCMKYYHFKLKTFMYFSI